MGIDTHDVATSGRAGAAIKMQLAAFAIVTICLIVPTNMEM